MFLHWPLVFRTGLRNGLLSCELSSQPLLNFARFSQSKAGLRNFRKVKSGLWIFPSPCEMAFGIFTTLRHFRKVKFGLWIFHRVKLGLRIFRMSYELLYFYDFPILQTIFKAFSHLFWNPPIIDHQKFKLVHNKIN